MVFYVALESNVTLFVYITIILKVMNIKVDFYFVWNVSFIFFFIWLFTYLLYLY